jgi:uncharacterized secreted repeat protein (TIGR03808 family)
MMTSPVPRSGLSRRSLVGAALLAPAAATRTLAQDSLGGLRGALDATEQGVVPGSPDDQGAALAEALATAEAAERPIFLPPGRYEVAAIELPRRAHLIGVPGATRLVFRGGPFMLRATHTAMLRLHGILIDGGNLPLTAEAGGLIDADNVEELVLDDCEIAGSAAAGASLRGCAGRVENSRVRGARTAGLSLSQSRGMSVIGNVVADCGDTGILVIRDEEGADDTILRGNRVSATAARSGGTGQYGNGINIAKANGVIVADNRVDGSAFSAIRCFSSDNIQVTGNIVTNSGEVGLYVEFAFEGAIVSDNLIDGAVGGISFANFMTYGGRLAVCSGNIVRNIRSGPRYADGTAQIGIGIGAEADVALTGNVVDNAVWGMQLGWGPYLRNVSATGNMIRRTDVGIAVSVVEGAGPAVISDNIIAEAEKGAIFGMRWEEVATGDLAREGAEAWPHLTISGNHA